MSQTLFALSPLDGRYTSKTTPLRDFLSETALTKTTNFINKRQAQLAKQRKFYEQLQKNL